MGWDGAGFPLSPADLHSGGCRWGTQQSTTEAPSTVETAVANRRIHHGIATGMAATAPVHVYTFTPLLIVSLHLFVAVNCSLLHSPCYSECCS